MSDLENKIHQLYDSGEYSAKEIGLEYDLDPHDVLDIIRSDPPDDYSFDPDFDYDSLSMLEPPSVFCEDDEEE